LKAQLKGKWFHDKKKKKTYEGIVSGQCIAMGELKRKKTNELGFSNLGLNHNKNNASFKVRVEWGIGGLKSKWRRLMKIFD
jgi:hypothetical protein